jgi:DNA primase
VTDDPVREIRSRVDLVDLVGQRVRLQRAGRSFKGLCPFHEEKTPSFFVNPERGVWHCFGCGEHGDCYTWLMKLEGITFPEALRRLGEKVGVEVGASRGGPSRGEREEMLEALSVAARFFRERLRQDRRAAGYLAARQIDPETAEQFGIGYAPASWDSLTMFLASQKVNLAAAANAGLVGTRRDGGYYDRFRDRLMFPVADAGDRIVGFGGRSIGPDGPKYLNSPETPVFHKANILYGWPLARREISARGFALVVEGYLDVISAHRAGLKNAVAAMGTAFSEAHCRLLGLGCDRVVLCFDADSPGQRAALGAADVLEAAGFDVRVARLAPGEDPDSLVCSGRSADLHQAVQEAVTAAEFRLDRVMARFDLQDAADRARMLAEAAKVLGRVQNAFERDRLIRKLAVYHPSFAQGTDVAESRIRREVDRAARGAAGGRAAGGGAAPGRGEAAAKTPRQRAIEKAEQILLRCLLESREKAALIVERLPVDGFVTEAARELAAEIYACRELGEDPLTVLFPGREGGGAARLASALLVTEGPPAPEAVILDCIERLVRESRRERLARLREKFNRGELSRDSAEYREFLSLQQECHG